MVLQTDLRDVGSDLIYRVGPRSLPISSSSQKEGEW